MAVYQGRNAKLTLGGTEIGFTGSWSISTEGGDGVNMRKAIEHTRMRFDKMTERQLWNRMGATTTRNKIEAFAIVAEEKGMLSIAAAARARLEELYGVISHGSTKAQKTVLKKSNGGKLLRRMDTA